MKKITWNSPVILSFALISLIALGLNTATNGATNQLLFSVYGGSLLNPLFYLRLFTHVLGHVNLTPVSYTHLDVYKRQFHYTSPFLKQSSYE